MSMSVMYIYLEVLYLFGELFGLQGLSAHDHDKHHEATYVSTYAHVQHRICFKAREIKEKRCERKKGQKGR